MDCQREPARAWRGWHERMTIGQLGNYMDTR